MTPRLSTALLATLLPVVAATAALAKDDGSGLRADTVINGHAISRNHVTLLSASFKQDRGLQPSEAESAARAELITQEVLAQAARRDGLDHKPQVADQLAYQERAILSRVYLEHYFEQHPITDASLEKTYEWNRANGKIIELKLRQVLLGSEADARKVREQLAKGADFATVARTNTVDPGGQGTGGDLGWFRPDIFVDHNFTDVVTTLKKGEISPPFRSRFGWHVVLLEDGPRPVAKPESFADLSDPAKQAIRQKTAQVQLENLTAQLTAKAKVTRGTTLAASTPATTTR